MVSQSPSFFNQKDAKNIHLDHKTNEEMNSESDSSSGSEDSMSLDEN